MEVASLVARFSVEGERTIPNAAQAADRAIDKVGDSADRNTSRVGGFFSGMGGFLLGGALIGGIGALGGALLKTSADAETMRNSLNIAVGDVDQAGKIFANVQAFAASTPFEFPELMESVVALESFGLTAEDWLGTVGDTAAGTGKSINQVTEAVLDAQTGSYERLKELGIMTRVEGDKLTFSYMENGKKVEKTVDRTNQELVNSTLQGIWNSKYEGAMEVQSKSFAGQWSTLKDNVMLRLQEMSAGIFGFATRALGFLNDIFAKGWEATIKDTFGQGALDVISGALDVFGKIGEGALTAISFAGNLVSAAFNGIKAAWDVLSGPLGDAWQAAKDLAQGFIDAFDAGQDVETILKRMPGPLQGVLRLFLNIADAAGDLWRGFQKGGFKEVGARLLGEIAQVAIQIPGAVVDVARALDRAFWDMMDQIDWHGVGVTLGEKVRALVLALPGVLIENWQTVVKAAALLVLGLPYLMFRNVKLLAPKAKELIEGFLEGLDINWTLIADWFAALPGKVLDAIPELLATLLVDGYQLLTGLQDGITQAWDGVIAPWLGGMAGRVLAAVPDLAQTLLFDGFQLLYGFANGMIQEWDKEIWPALSGLPGIILAAVPDMSSTLFNHGFNLFWGFAQGMGSAIQFVRDKINELLGLLALIPDLPFGMSTGRSTPPTGGRSTAGFRSTPAPIRSSAAGGRATQPIVINLAGAIMGKGAAAEIMALIEGDVRSIANGSARSFRMAEVRG